MRQGQAVLCVVAWVFRLARVLKTGQARKQEDGGWGRLQLPSYCQAGLDSFPA